MPVNFGASLAAAAAVQMQWLSPADLTGSPTSSAAAASSDHVVVSAALPRGVPASYRDALLAAIDAASGGQGIPYPAPTEAGGDLPMLSHRQGSAETLSFVTLRTSSGDSVNSAPTTGTTTTSANVGGFRSFWPFRRPHVAFSILAANDAGRAHTLLDGIASKVPGALPFVFLALSDGCTDEVKAKCEEVGTTLSSRVGLLRRGGAGVDIPPLEAQVRSILEHVVAPQVLSSASRTLVYLDDHKKVLGHFTTGAVPPPTTQLETHATLRSLRVRADTYIAIGQAKDAFRLLTEANDLVRPAVSAAAVAPPAASGSVLGGASMPRLGSRATSQQAVDMSQSQLSMSAAASSSKQQQRRDAPSLIMTPVWASGTMQTIAAVRFAEIAPLLKDLPAIRRVLHAPTDVRDTAEFTHDLGWALTTLQDVLAGTEPAGRCHHLKLSALLAMRPGVGEAATSEAAAQHQTTEDALRDSLRELMQALAEASAPPLPGASDEQAAEHAAAAIVLGRTVERYLFHAVDEVHHCLKHAAKLLGAAVRSSKQHALEISELILELTLMRARLHVEPMCDVNRLRSTLRDAKNAAGDRATAHQLAVHTAEIYAAAGLRRRALKTLLVPPMALDGDGKKPLMSLPGVSLDAGSETCVAQVSAPSFASDITEAILGASESMGSPILPALNDGRSELRAVLAARDSVDEEARSGWGAVGSRKRHDAPPAAHIATHWLIQRLSAATTTTTSATTTRRQLLRLAAACLRTYCAIGCSLHSLPGNAKDQKLLISAVSSRGAPGALTPIPPTPLAAFAPRFVRWATPLPLPSDEAPQLMELSKGGVPGAPPDFVYVAGGEAVIPGRTPVWATDAVGTVAIQLINPLAVDVSLSEVVPVLVSRADAARLLREPKSSVTGVAIDAFPTSIKLRTRRTSSSSSASANGQSTAHLSVRPLVGGYLSVVGVHATWNGHRLFLPFTAPADVYVEDSLPRCKLALLSEGPFTVFAGRSLHIPARLSNVGKYELDLSPPLPSAGEHQQQPPPNRISVTAHFPWCKTESCPGCARSRSSAAVDAGREDLLVICDATEHESAGFDRITVGGVHDPESYRELTINCHPPLIAKLTPDRFLSPTTLVLRAHYGQRPPTALDDPWRPAIREEHAGMVVALSLRARTATVQFSVTPARGVDLVGGPVAAEGRYVKLMLENRNPHHHAVIHGSHQCAIDRTRSTTELGPRQQGEVWLVVAGDDDEEAAAATTSDGTTANPTPSSPLLAAAAAAAAAAADRVSAFAPAAPSPTTTATTASMERQGTTLLQFLAGSSSFVGPCGDAMDASDSAADGAAAIPFGSVEVGWSVPRLPQAAGSVSIPFADVLDALCRARALSDRLSLSVTTVDASGGSAATSSSAAPPPVQSNHTKGKKKGGRKATATTAAADGDGDAGDAPTPGWAWSWPPSQRDVAAAAAVSPPPGHHRGATTTGDGAQHQHYQHQRHRALRLVPGVPLTVCIRVQVLTVGTGAVRLAVGAAVPQLKLIGNTRTTLKPLNPDGVSANEKLYVTLLATNACDAELELEVTDRNGGHCAPRLPIRARGATDSV